MVGVNMYMYTADLLNPNNPFESEWVITEP